jgi:predicted Kef-type K+ transport protein
VPCSSFDDGGSVTGKSRTVHWEREPSSYASIPALESMLTMILALIMVGKLVMWTAVVRCFGYGTRVAFYVAAGLTQIGEFSFILTQAAKTAWHIGDDVYNAVLAASLITILLNATLVRCIPGFREGDRVLQHA